MARIDNLQFLDDTIPQTITYKEYNRRRANKATKAPRPLQNGQTTIDGSHQASDLPNESNDFHKASAEDHIMADTTVDAHHANTQAPESSSANGDDSHLTIEHWKPNGDPGPDQPEDVEMG